MTTENDHAAHDLDEAARQFGDCRRRLFGIAYRMVGTASDAEDIVQDVWIRWQAYDRSVVREPAAFLATTTTRMAINFLQSARARHEAYIGPWLPEPVDTSNDPTLGAERGEALSFAILLLLEKLTPTERAAYVLREAFDYSYAEIADVVQRGETATRQLVSRARKHLRAERRAQVPDEDQRRLLDAFLVAAQHGDVAGLERILAADVVSYSDGNGVKLAARIPVIGRGRVASFVAAFSSHFWIGKILKPIRLNGQPAMALVEDGRITTAVTITASASGIEQLLWLMSPEKLRRLTSADA